MGPQQGHDETRHVRMRARVLAWMWAFLCTAPVSAIATGDTARTPGGLLRPTPAEPETWGETFTAVTNLEDGSYALLQLVFSNAGLGDRKGSCRLLWIPRGKPALHSTQHVDEQGWHYDAPATASAGERLRVGSCSLHAGSGQTRFEATFEGTRVELVADAAPRRAVTTERISQSRGFYEGELLIPWARARLRISGGAAPGPEMHGMMSLDHTRTTLLIPQVASAWFRFRGASRGQPLVIHARLTPEGKLAPGFVWLQGHARPEPLKGAEATIEDPDGLPHLRLDTERGESEIRAFERLFAFEPTKSFGLLGTLARPFVGNPVTRTYRAEWRQGEQVIPGTLEWSRIGDR